MQTREIKGEIGVEVHWFFFGNKTVYSVDSKPEHHYAARCSAGLTASLFGDEVAFIRKNCILHGKLEILFFFAVLFCKTNRRGWNRKKKEGKKINRKKINLLDFHLTDSLKLNKKVLKNYFNFSLTVASK